jgi:heme-degrading monooxygenase HmoA
MILTVFRSRVREQAHVEYLEMATRISALARSLPGYIGHKSFEAADGEQVTIVEFEDEAALRNGSMHTDHVAAKRAGRQRFYTEYSVQVCTVINQSRFASAPPG